MRCGETGQLGASFLETPKTGIDVEAQREKERITWTKA